MLTLLKEEEMEILKMIYVPFTDEQVKNLNNFQKNGRIHPFTCCSPEDIVECRSGEGTSKGLLEATNNGWVCPCGKYTQDWAYEFMTNTITITK